jgi:hypothetical protein
VWQLLNNVPGRTCGRLYGWLIQPYSSHSRRGTFFGLVSSALMPLFFLIETPRF